MERVWCLLIGYIFGMFQTAVLYCRLKGVDIRSVGSGNAGTTNTLRVMGAKAGLTVLVGDMLKCILAILITFFLFGKAHPELTHLYMVYTTAGCVLGHDFPFYLNFKGGKGIACTSGFIIMMGWKYVIAGLILFFLPFNLTHFVSLGSLCLYGIFYILFIIDGQVGLFGPGLLGASLVDMAQGPKIECYIILGLLTVLAYYQHRTNIKKLLSGKERKTYIFKKNKID